MQTCPYLCKDKWLIISWLVGARKKLISMLTHLRFYLGSNLSSKLGFGIFKPKLQFFVEIEFGFKLWNYLLKLKVEPKLIYYPFSTCIGSLPTLVESFTICNN